MPRPVSLDVSSSQPDIDGQKPPAGLRERRLREDAFLDWNRRGGLRTRLLCAACDRLPAALPRSRLQLGVRLLVQRWATPLLAGGLLGLLRSMFARIDWAQAIMDADMGTAIAAATK